VYEEPDKRIFGLETGWIHTFQPGKNFMTGEEYV
jgi:hypothetical protein